MEQFCKTRGSRGDFLVCFGKRHYYLSCILEIRQRHAEAKKPMPRSVWVARLVVRLAPRTETMAPSSCTCIQDQSIGFQATASVKRETRQCLGIHWKTTETTIHKVRRSHENCVEPSSRLLAKNNDKVSAPSSGVSCEIGELAQEEQIKRQKPR